MKFGAGDTGRDLSATQQAYLKLRQMILTGVLPPDGKLKIDDLRAELDTGASPIREALSLLTSDQLVVRQDQKGFRTAATSPENFQEILELRCSLEEMALRQSVAGATSAWEEALVLAHHRMTRAIGESVEIFEARHKDFHMALINNCDMPLLLRFCDQLYDLNIRYRYSAGRSSGYIGRDVATEHADIIAAVIDHDADVAANLLKTHYTKTGAFLRDHL